MFRIGGCSGGSSGVCGQESLVRQPAGEFLNVERLVEASVQSLGVGEKADLCRLASEQASDIGLDPTRCRPLRRGAARRAVAYVAYLVGEDFAIEPFDPRGHLWFVAEQPDAHAAQFVEHYAACHFGSAHECEPEPLREENVDLDELAHH